VGSRANYVILRDRRLDIRYHHWGAASVPQDLFWGPDASLAFIRSLELNETLMDDIWCEGSALVDLDHQALCLWGGDELLSSIPLRRLYPRMLQQTWPGWQVSWANGGVVDIARRVGIDPAPLLQLGLPDSADAGSPHSDESLDRALVAEPSMIITVRDAEGIRDFRCGWQLSHVALMGPGVVDKLRAKPAAGLLPEGQIRDCLFIDAPSKRVWICWGDPSRWRIGMIIDRWPGWVVAQQFEGLLRHVEFSGRAVESVRMPVAEALSRLEKELLSRSVVDPAAILEAYKKSPTPDEKESLVIAPGFLRNLQPPLTREERERRFREIAHSITLEGLP
jgi:hypothetical protein